jgi:hypothetical protein
MITARGLVKCLLVALIIGAVIAFVVSLTAGLVLGTAIAVGSISLLPVAPPELKALERKRRLGSASEPQRRTVIEPKQSVAPLAERIIVTIPRPKPLPLRDATEETINAHQSERRNR